MNSCSRFVTDVVELQKVMLERGIKTKKQLSEVCNINRNTAGRIIEGKEQPSSATMYKLVYGLKINPHRAGSIFFSQNLRIT